MSLYSVSSSVPDHVDHLWLPVSLGTAITDAPCTAADIHATLQELQIYLEMETRLMQDLVTAQWELPPAAAGSPSQLTERARYSFSWISLVPVDPETNLTFPSDGRGTSCASRGGTTTLCRRYLHRA